MGTRLRRSRSSRFEDRPASLERTAPEHVITSKIHIPDAGWIVLQHESIAALYASVIASIKMGANVNYIKVTVDSTDVSDYVKGEMRKVF